MSVALLVAASACWTLMSFCSSVIQLKSNPSTREEQEAQSQLKKADEIQRLVAQAQSDFSRKDYSSAASYLDVIIDVSKPERLAQMFIFDLEVVFALGVLPLSWCCVSFFGRALRLKMSCLFVHSRSQAI